MRKLFLLICVCGYLIAQQQTAPPAGTPQPQKEPQTTNDQLTPFSMTIQNVVVPAIVFDHDGHSVAGIRPDEFHLYDNGKEQNIHVDEAFIPISMVVAVQANEEVTDILSQVNKIGTLISPLILGNQGEAAVVAFDHRIRTIQDFTSDPDKISLAVQKLYPGSSSSRLIDAVEESTRMLRTRPRNRRRILLLISEARDMGSEARGRETLMSLELSNITVYFVPMSNLLAKLTAPPKEPRPDNLPPAMHPMPGVAPATPTTVMQTYGTDGNSAQFVPLITEIFKDAKAIFKAPPAQLFVQATGGSEFSFYGRRALEQVVQKIGAELHSDYTISYDPNNKLEGGFHQIQIVVSGHPEVKRVQARPGYWLAATQ
ncbi:MAG TPA: VWA domain-containing protein [Candidatus Limnocylindrales bacterium]|nr:VWA domain-containing protein [Candidatus Limnocylindrales bacterium]